MSNIIEYEPGFEQPRAIHGTLVKFKDGEWADNHGLPLPDTLIVTRTSRVLQAYRKGQFETIFPEPGRSLPHVDDLNDAIPRSEWEINRHTVKAIMIDPITAYLGFGKIDSYRTTDVRAVLAPLRDLAEELNVSIIGLMHFNKKIEVTNVLLRVSDSLAFVAAPRHVFAVIDDAENARKLFVRAKNNLASAEQKRKSLAFTFEEVRAGVDARTGAPVTAPRIVWQPGYVDISATEALSAAAENKSPSARENAKDFLREILARGGGRVASADVEEAAKAEKIAPATLRRAKDELKVKVKKEGSKWFWVQKSTDDI